MEGKVGGASQTDSLPDILAGDVVRIPYWASEGIFTDITKQIDGLDNKADLQQGHIEAGTVDGAEYTLPFITDVSVMVWNKNLYKEAGLDPGAGSEEHRPVRRAGQEGRRPQQGWRRRLLPRRSVRWCSGLRPLPVRVG